MRIERTEEYRKVDMLMLRMRKELATVFATFWNGTETLDEDANLWVFVRLWEQVVNEAMQGLLAIPEVYAWPVEHEVQRVAWSKAKKAPRPDPSWGQGRVIEWLKEIVIPMYEELEKGQQATLARAGQEAAGLLH